MESNSNEDPAWYENRQRKVRFDEREVAAFVRQVGRDLAQGREFAVVIASDDSVRRANIQFRGQHSSTDVLSFPDGEGGRLGDILISAAQAARQAGELGHHVEEELKVLILHGLLHLLGYDHQAESDRMRRREIACRKKYGLQPGLIERATS